MNEMSSLFIERSGKPVFFHVNFHHNDLKLLTFKQAIFYSFMKLKY